MSGALTALIEKKVKFDVISTAGAGAFVGLLHAASRNGSPLEALKNTVDISISDWIYQFFPVNYKVYQKPGAAAQAYRDMVDTLPWFNTMPHPDHPTSWQRLFSD
jgi:predicted acylesterase/phospholipase RssA